MAKIAPSFRQQFFDGNGDPLSDGLLYTYEAGTSTPKETFTSSSETASNPNPIVLDADGVADIWLASGSYKFILRDSDDVLVQTVDNILGDSTVGFNGSVTSAASNLTVSTAYQNANIIVSATANLTLLPATSAGEGFVFTVYNSGTGTVTLDPDATETINGSLTLELSQGEWAIVTCDGSNWGALAYKDVKSNLSATTDPTSSNDDTEGYSQNSTWFNTSSSPVEIWRCVDASAGAAVWVKTSLTIDELGSAALASTIDEDDMDSDSDTALPTQQSVKSYVDTNTGITWSSAIAVSSGNGTYTFAHGLASKPSKIYMKLVCATADKGYAVGDEVWNYTATDPAIGLTAIGCDSTNVFYAQRSAIPLVNKNGLNYTAITYASWELYLGYKA